MTEIITPARAARPTTPRFRLSFPQVFEAKSFNGGKPRFSLTALVWPKQFSDGDKAKWAQLKAEMNRVCLEFFKKDLKTMRATPNFKFPFHAGNEKDYNGYGDPDMIFFTMANSVKRPEIIDQFLKPIGPERSDELYPGCWCRASYSVYAFDILGKGVSIGLNNLRKLGDDVPFDSSSRAVDDFGADPEDAFMVEGDDTASPTAADDFLDL